MIFIILLTMVSVPIPTMDGPAPRMAAEVEPCPLIYLEAGFSIQRVSCFDRGDSDVCIIVASGLEIPLAPELAQFALDLEAEGFDVSTSVMTGGTSSDLREFLQGQTELGGAILIGNLPVAWYEMDEWGHEEFPMDLYFMDLDGIWSDSDVDGLLDGHSGDRAPEIWIGRIDPHAMEFGNELFLLKDYFAKNHAYRTGSMAVPARALAFNDDDWHYCDDEGLDYIYSTVDVINNSTETTAAYYCDRLAYGYEFVHVMTHSSPWGHTFMVPSGYSGTVTAPEISAINPQTVFVQLFACSNTRWTEPNCLGNWYLFGDDFGQLAIGSTKTGAMLSFEAFYQPIGEGKIPGAAFSDWFATVGIYNPPWHYGCGLLGDPTLQPLSSKDAGSNLESSSADNVFLEYESISTSLFSDCYPVAVYDYSSSKTYCAWVTGNNGRLDINARIHDGSNWGPVITVDPDAYWDVTPFLEIDGSGIPYLAWGDFGLANYDYNIKVAYGSDFSTVNTVTSESGYNVDPKLVWTDRMWLIWQTWQRAEGDIMLKSLDGSITETFVSNVETDDFSPAACADPAGNDVHIAWVEGSTDGERIVWISGNEFGFSSAQELSSGSFCRAPDIAVASGQMFLVWQEDDNGSSIRARVWSGSGWEPEQELYSSVSETAVVPVIGESPLGNAFVAWQLGKGTNAQIWHSAYDGVSGWSTPSLLVDPEGPAWLPALAHGIIAWAGTGGEYNWDIYVSMDGGVGINPGEENQEYNFTLERNPVRSTAYINIESDYEGSFNADTKLFDISGKLIYDSREFITSGESLQIPCGNFPSGIYLIRIETDNTIWTGRMTLLK